MSECHSPAALEVGEIIIGRLLRRLVPGDDRCQRIAAEGYEALIGIFIRLEEHLALEGGHGEPGEKGPFPFL